MRLSTHTIQLRSMTSPTSPNAHGSDPLPPFSCARTARKYSRNHFVTNSSRKLSFSVIFGRSDLMSLSNDSRKAACQTSSDRETSVRERQDHMRYGRLRTIKTRFNERASEPAQHRPGFRCQIVVARKLVLLFPLLFVLTLDEIYHGPRILAQRLLSMQDKRPGR